jgi:hypothetical protein
MTFEEWWDQRRFGPTTQKQIASDAWKFCESQMIDKYKAFGEVLYKQTVAETADTCIEIVKSKWDEYLEPDSACGECTGVDRCGECTAKAIRRHFGIGERNDL